jgi:hypothetical protein
MMERANAIEGVQGAMSIEEPGRRHNNNNRRGNHKRRNGTTTSKEKPK